MFLFLRLCLSPRGATLSLLRWLLCALVPAWLCGGVSLAAAATRAAASMVEVVTPAVAAPELISSEDSQAAASPADASDTAAPDVVVADAVIPLVIRGDVLLADARDEGAPMCDPHGASVAAQPEIPEVDHGKLEQLPCDDAWLLWLGSTLEQAHGQAAARDGVPPAPPPQLQVARSRLDGVLPLVIAMPERVQPLQLPRSEVAGLPARAGHRLSIYRPPLY